MALCSLPAHGISSVAFSASSVLFEFLISIDLYSVVTSGLRAWGQKGYFKVSRKTLVHGAVFWALFGFCPSYIAHLKIWHMGRKRYMTGKNERTQTRAHLFQSHQPHVFLLVTQGPSYFALFMLLFELSLIHACSFNDTQHEFFQMVTFLYIVLEIKIRAMGPSTTPLIMDLFLSRAAGPASLPLYLNPHLFSEN